jgi:hypothetical protein
MIRRLVSGRRAVFERRVAALVVVEDLDVPDQRSPGFECVTPFAEQTDLDAKVASCARKVAGLFGERDGFSFGSRPSVICGSW